MDNTQETITAIELARLWGVSSATITEWASKANDPLPSVWRTPFRRGYIRKDALEWYTRRMSALNNEGVSKNEG